MTTDFSFFANYLPDWTSELHDNGEYDAFDRFIDLVRANVMAVRAWPARILHETFLASSADEVPASVKQFLEDFHSNNDRSVWSNATLLSLEACATAPYPGDAARFSDMFDDPDAVDFYRTLSRLDEQQSEKLAYAVSTLLGSAITHALVDHDPTIDDGALCEPPKVFPDRPAAPGPFQLLTTTTEMDSYADMDMFSVIAMANPDSFPDAIYYRSIVRSDDPALKDALRWEPMFDAISPSVDVDALGKPANNTPTVRTETLLFFTDPEGPARGVLHYTVEANPLLQSCHLHLGLFATFGHCEEDDDEQVLNSMSAVLMWILRDDLHQWRKVVAPGETLTFHLTPERGNDEAILLELEQSLVWMTEDESEIALTGFSVTVQRSAPGAIDIGLPPIEHHVVDAPGAEELRRLLDRLAFCGGTGEALVKIEGRRARASVYRNSNEPPEDTLAIECWKQLAELVQSDQFAQLLPKIRTAFRHDGDFTIIHHNWVGTFVYPVETLENNEWDLDHGIQGFWPNARLLYRAPEATSMFWRIHPRALRKLTAEMKDAAPADR